MKRPLTKIAMDDVIEQAGALCRRMSDAGECEILLVGSLRNGRWGLPKGHIDPGEASHMAAAREAYEEAGIRGDIADTIVGSFVYTKGSSANRYRSFPHSHRDRRDLPGKGVAKSGVVHSLRGARRRWPRGTW